DKIFNHPGHPYTQMLMASVPRLDKKWEDVEIELKAKQVPVYQGCPYYGRCPKAKGTCAHNRPPLIEVEADHHIACFQYEAR
ncbi:MAG: hypothetical protein PVG63_05110, partial [Anaerolineales bacterium]